ncbi:hypothetical protein BJ170DRAFT_581865 [Xylariales sp. AK1849]|nr:hypothetical protein BJ170DRAFT_581865 [Xylariales sp. AK1849]
MAGSGDAKPSGYISAFQETIDSVPEPISDVLETYSGIPKDAQIEHIIDLRNAAYERCPYPCIGNLRFLDFDLSAHPLYQDHVLAPLKAPSKEGEAEPLFLDLGTCFGQDVRKLVYDGAPVGRLWASDIEQHLIDMGFKLFNDEKKLPRSHFLCPGDLLTDSSEDKLKELDDRVTILHMTAVFHLFTLDDQRMVVDRCLRLLRKDTRGPVLLLGMQVGSVEAGPFLRENVTQEYSHKYRHSVQSWRQLWKDVAESDGWKSRIKNLDVKSNLLERDSKPKGSAEKTPVGDTGMRRHVFEVSVTFD